jgi:hypothetical protein
MWPASVLTFLYFKIFLSQAKKVKKVFYPSSRLSIAVILLSDNTKDRASRTSCSVVTAAKEFDISQGFPPRGPYTVIVQ